MSGLLDGSPGLLVKVSGGVTAVVNTDFITSYCYSLQGQNKRVQDIKVVRRADLPLSPKVVIIGG